MPLNLFHLVVIVYVRILGLNLIGEKRLEKFAEDLSFVHYLLES
jgi:hypothetical protein